MGFSNKVSFCNQVLEINQMKVINHLKWQLWYLIFSTYFPPFCKQKQVGSRLCIAPTIVGSLMDLLIQASIHDKPVRPEPALTNLLKTPLCHLHAIKEEISHFVTITSKLISSWICIFYFSKTIKILIIKFFHW